MSYSRTDGGLRFRGDLWSSSGARFLLRAAVHKDVQPRPVVEGQVGPDGHGAVSFFVQSPSALEGLDALHFQALVATPSGPVTTEWKTLVLGLDPSCERHSFNFDVESNQLPAGTIIDEQWADAGLHISAESTHPLGTDTVIIFDSGNPTGGDTDLQTPGYGIDNDTALGNLLIIAEDVVDVDGDGLVDDPDDDEDGGTITILHDRPVTMCSLGLIDLDKSGIGSVIRFFDAGDALLDQIVLPSLGDNSFQEVEFFITNVSRVEIFFVGSGGIPYMTLIPCPSRVDFDANTFGVPIGGEAGELVDTLTQLGGVVTAENNHPAHPDQAILFDTANPTGGDTDLQTPGYGIGNDTPLGLVLILAENVVDADGDDIVDVPDDEAEGGMIAIDLGLDVVFESATVIDVDTNEVSFFRLLDAQGLLITTLPLASLGDNSVQTIEAAVAGVRRIELHLGGSGALAELVLCPEPSSIEE